MGKVIPLERPSERRRFAHPPDAPKLSDIALDEAELEWLAQRAGEIACARPFTESDFRGLIRVLALTRATGALVEVSDTDGDLAIAVERRRQQILADLVL